MACAPCQSRTKAMMEMAARGHNRSGPMSAKRPCDDCDAGEHDACTEAAGRIVIPVEVGSKTVEIVRVCSCLLSGHRNPEPEAPVAS